MGSEQRPQLPSYKRDLSTVIRWAGLVFALPIILLVVSESFEFARLHRIAASFPRVAVGDDKHTVRSILGAPQSIFTVDDWTPEEIWVYGRSRILGMRKVRIFLQSSDDYAVTFSKDGKVTELIRPE
jgi:hypothetical protein